MAIVKLNIIDEKSNIPEIIRVEYTVKYAKVFLIEIPRETKKLKYFHDEYKSLYLLKKRFSAK